MLMTILFNSESRKRPHTEDSPPAPATRASVMPHGRREEGSDPAASADCSRSKYPNIKFWTKEEWLASEGKKSESTDPTDIDKTSLRGKARLAQGENVRSTFIETEKGEPVGGKEASDIRHYARSIWKEFYARGAAPRKWGDAPKNVREKYEDDMEARWPVLRYCANHWKANHIAQLAYPPWFKYHNKKMGGVQGTKQMGPPQKKVKKTVDSDADDDSADDYETDSRPNADTTHEASDDSEDRDTTVPSWLNEDIQEGPSTRDKSRPRARPLKIGDPL